MMTHDEEIITLNLHWLADKKQEKRWYSAYETKGK